MRASLGALVVSAVVVATVYGAEAFNVADTGARAVTATVASDSAAYLALSARPDGPWARFVEEDPDTGLLSVRFAGPYDDGPSGMGVNPKSVYYFDDLIQITNQGTSAVFVQAASIAVQVCYAPSIEAMMNGCYSTLAPSVAAPLSVGETAYLGIAVDSSAIEGKHEMPVTGSIRVYACRSATDDCSFG